jgi:nicotinate-nucleotide adenylyltransferase
MLRLALAGENGYEVDDQETRRGGVSYTIETVRDYRRRYPAADLLYLIGADHTGKLLQWREAAELARLVEFVVITRPGEAAGLPAAPFRSRPLRGFPLALSSSEIRARVKAGLSIRHLVAPAVAEFIRQNRLYLATTSA